MKILFDTKLEPRLLNVRVRVSGIFVAVVGVFVAAAGVWMYFVGFKLYRHVGYILRADVYLFAPEEKFVDGRFLVNEKIFLFHFVLIQSGVKIKLKRQPKFFLFAHAIAYSEKIWVHTVLAEPTARVGVGWGGKIYRFVY